MSHFAPSDAGLDLIKRFEGFRAVPEALGADRWVIGYGHVGEGEPPAEWSVDEAHAALHQDVAPIHAVLGAAGRDLSDNQTAALLSFAFSVGVKEFERSQAWRLVRAGRDVEAACAMDAWRKATVEGETEVCDRLIRRRAEEKALYLRAPAPTHPAPYRRAELDYAASILAAPLKAAPAATAPTPAVETVQAHAAPDPVLVLTTPAEAILSEAAPSVAPSDAPQQFYREVASRDVVRRERADAASTRSKVLFVGGAALLVLAAAASVAGHGGLEDIALVCALGLPGALACATGAMQLRRSRQFAAV